MSCVGGHSETWSCGGSGEIRAEVEAKAAAAQQDVDEVMVFSIFLYAASGGGLAERADGMVNRVLNGRLDGMLDGMFGGMRYN